MNFGPRKANKSGIYVLLNEMINVVNTLLVPPLSFGAINNGGGGGGGRGVVSR